MQRIGPAGGYSVKMSALIFTEGSPGIQAVRRPVRLWLKPFRLYREKARCKATGPRRKVNFES
jgi:hypothetical protein